MAPGSEHLRQMRKISAVVNGGQEQQEEMFSFCSLVQSLLWTPDGGSPEPEPSAKCWEPPSWSFLRGAHGADADP